MLQALDTTQEAQFRDELRQSAVMSVRVACVLGCISFFVFGFIDPLLVPWPDISLIVTRAVIVVLLGAILAFSYSPSFSRWVGAAHLAAFFIIGGGAIAVTQQVGGAATIYHEGLLLTIFGFSVLVFAWTWIQALVCFSLLVLAYNLTMWLTGVAGTPAQWVPTSGILWLSVLISTTAVFVTGRLRRDAFEGRLRLVHEQDEILRLNASLLALTQNTTIDAGARAAAFQEICKATSQALDIARVSIWVYDADREAIICEELYEQGSDTHSSGLTLFQKDFPSYFAYLRKEYVLAAHNAHTDAATAEFSSVYLTPLGINSMLDAPVRFEGKFWGVVCIEHVGPQRRWSTEEQTFSASIADFAARALSAERRAVAQTLVQQRSAALRDSEGQLRQITDSAMDAVVQMDSTGVIIRWNNQAEKIFGWPRVEAIGRLLHETIIPPQYREMHIRGMKHFLASGEGPVLNKRIEITALHRDGHEFPIELAVTPLKMADKHEFSAFIRDITEIKRIDRMKTEFISTVSHELRTPLTSIRGALGLIAGGVAGALPEAVKNLVDIAKNNCERLIRLINDLLDSEKIESGKMQLNLQVLDIKPLLQQALAANQGFAGQYRVTLLLQAPDEPLQVRIDSDRLSQVLTNLLSNAVKFSAPEGVVEVRVSRLGQQVRVEVADHGAGIPEEFKSRIFQKFSQADASDTKQKGGTGLGLNISKALVEQMGGQIGFSSQAGAGSTFFFEIPEWKAPAEFLGSEPKFAEPSARPPGAVLRTAAKLVSDPNNSQTPR